MIYPEDKLIAAIDRNTEAIKDSAYQIAGAVREAAEDLSATITFSGALICLVMIVLSIGCPRANAAPLVSDGDEIASVGTVQVVTPHPSWAQPIGGSQWISIAQTGWPLHAWLPNGTVVSFFEVFSLASMPSAAMVTFAADDSASLWVNGDLVVAEAEMAGNAYTVCSDTGVTCRSHTSVDVLPWLALGENTLRFDVAQRGGWSYGLNYSVALQWLDEPPLPLPEPGTWIAVALGAPMLFGYAMAELSHRRMLRKMKAAQRRNELVAEFVDKQLWQFISLDDWLTKHPETARKALEE